MDRDRVPLRAPDGPLRARLDPGSPPPSIDRRSGVARFVDRFGWRAYALPVLVVATILGVGNIAASGAPNTNHTAGAATTSSPTPSGAKQTPTPKPTPTPTHRPSPTSDLPSTPPPAGASVAALPTGTATYATSGDGAFQIVPGTSKPVGHGPVKRYAVEVEGGMTGVDAAAFADSVTKTLSDPRSWSRSGVTLQRVDSGPIDFRVTLTSVLTIRKKCGYTLPVETSCYNSAEARAFINVSRWVRGAVSYGQDVADYRHYVVNHEVGHALGHGHVKCPKAGAPAPIMMEQTLGVTTPGVGACLPNPWPYVHGRLATGPPTAGY